MAEGVGVHKHVEWLLVVPFRLCLWVCAKKLAHVNLEGVVCACNTDFMYYSTAVHYNILDDSMFVYQYKLRFLIKKL